MILQRSEQNGRQREAGVHGTVAPQFGQATMRAFPISDFGGVTAAAMAQSVTPLSARIVSVPLLSVARRR